MKNMNRNKMSWTILGLTVAFWIPYNEYAKSNASKDIATVNKYLMRAYDNGSDIEARDALSRAAYETRLAMNKCSWG